MSTEGAHVDPGLGDAVNAVLAMQGVYDNRYNLPDGSVALNDNGVGGAGATFSLSGLDDNEGLSALVNAAEVTADLQMQYQHDGGMASSDADVQAHAHAQAEAEAARRREVDDFGLDPMDHGGHDVGDGSTDDLMPFYADQLSLPRAQPEHEVRGRNLHHPDADVGVGGGIGAGDGMGLGAGGVGVGIGGGQGVYDVDGHGQVQQPLQQQHHTQQHQLHQHHQHQQQQEQAHDESHHHEVQAQTLSTPSAEPPAKRARRTKAGTPSPLSLHDDNGEDEDVENSLSSPNTVPASGRRGKASTVGKSPHGSRPTLERKIAHKVAEQQRRAMIRTGYEALYAVIPALAEAELQEGKVRGGSGPGGGGAVGGKRRDRIRMQTKPDDEEAAARAAQATLDSALRKRGPKKGSKRIKKLSPEEEEEMEREREREHERAHQARQQEHERQQQQQHHQQGYSNDDIIGGGGPGGSGNNNAGGNDISDFVNDVTLDHSHSHPHSQTQAQGHLNGRTGLSDEHAVNDHLSNLDPNDPYLDEHDLQHTRTRSQSQGKSPVSASYPPKPTKEIANVRNTANEIVDGRQGPRSETVVLQTTIDYLREQQRIRISHLSRLQTLRALAYVKFPPNQHEELGLGPRWVEADEDVIQPVGGMTARGGRPMAGKKDGDEDGPSSTRSGTGKGKGKGKGKKKATADEVDAPGEPDVEMGGGQIRSNEGQHQSEIDNSFNLATGSSGVTQGSTAPFTAPNGEQDAVPTLAGFVPPPSAAEDAANLFLASSGGQAGENNDVEMEGQQQNQQQSSGLNAGQDAFEPIRKVWVNWEDDWQGAKAVETAMGGA